MRCPICFEFSTSRAMHTRDFPHIELNTNHDSYLGSFWHLMHVERESDIFRKIKKEEEEREREKKKKTNSRLGVICLYIIHVGSDVYMRASTLCCFHSHSTETVPKFLYRVRLLGAISVSRCTEIQRAPFHGLTYHERVWRKGAGKRSLGCAGTAQMGDLWTAYPTEWIHIQSYRYVTVLLRSTHCLVQQMVRG